MRAPSALVGCVVSRGNLQAGGLEPGLTHNAGTLGPWDPARVACLIKRLRQFLDGSARVGLRHLMDLSGWTDGKLAAASPVCSCGSLSSRAASCIGKSLGRASLSFHRNHDARIGFW